MLNLNLGGETGLITLLYGVYVDLLPWHQTVALGPEGMQETNVSDSHSLIVRCYSHIQAI